MERIYERVEKLCEAKGISIKSCEASAGIGNGTIGKWKEKTPNIATVKKVADALDVSIMDLIGAED